MQAGFIVLLSRGRYCKFLKPGGPGVASSDFGAQGAPICTLGLLTL